MRAGHGDDLARPGDQRGLRVGKDSLLLVRGEDGTLRGFYNVCRHRAHELLQAGERTSDPSIRCPYHGWVYRLDGSLHPAVRGGHAPGFDPAAEGLLPARISVGHGWVFVNASVSRATPRGLGRQPRGAEPLAPSRTRIECPWLFAPESFEAPGFDPRYAVKFWDATNCQDWRAVESVQRGVASRGYVPGTLTPQEDALHQFVTRVARAYLEGRFDPLPRPAPVP